MNIVHKNNDVEVNNIFHSVAKIKQNRDYRLRFIVNKGCISFILAVKDIAYFHVSGNALFAVDFNQQQHLLSTTMKVVEDELDPKSFFRCNRQFMINISCVSSFEHYFNYKLLIKTNPDSHEKITVSRQNANNFKEWIDR